MDCIVHGVSKNWTQLSDFHFVTFTFSLSTTGGISVFLHPLRSFLFMVIPQCMKWHLTVALICIFLVII